MAINSLAMSVEQFEAFVERPENADALFEFVGEKLLKRLLMPIYPS